MYVTKAKIKNYRTLRSTEVEFNQGTNLIVGYNEAGKSTLIEAINLALTGQINGRSILYDLHPFLFNYSAVREYIKALNDGNKPQPPFIEIELYFDNDSEFASLKGTNNSDSADIPGVLFRVELNDSFAEDYIEYTSGTGVFATLPIEFYRVVWRSFAGKDLSPRTRPVKTTMIDTGDLRYSAGPQRYVLDVVSDFLSQSDRAKLALSYRHMKEVFQDDKNVAAVNANLAKSKGDISEKTISVSLDSTVKGSWEAGIVTNLDDIPFNLVGKGEQSSIKLQLAMADDADVEIFLIEEPENHLSFPRLHELLTKIEVKAGGRQTFITTHSNFVLNKLDVGQVMLFNGILGVRLNDLKQETRDYFKKLPGHDTLRMILARKVILVEGPSEELLVQRAILQKYSKTYLAMGVDIISVNSLAFKRFLEIAAALSIQTRVITDNDGDVASLREKYADFNGSPFIEICYDTNESFPSLEDQILKSNSLATINSILGQHRVSEADLVAHMKRNKTETALKIFNVTDEIQMPDYIQHAIRELDN